MARIVIFAIALQFCLVLPVYGADLGFGVGQNGVQMAELNYGVFNYARHTGDGAVNVFSIRLSHTWNISVFDVKLFAGLGYGDASGNPKDLEVSTIGHWGGEIAYCHVGMRLSHWSNPFESSEYGHNLLTIFYRW